GSNERTKIEITLLNSCLDNILIEERFQELFFTNFKTYILARITSIKDLASQIHTNDSVLGEMLNGGRPFRWSTLAALFVAMKLNLRVHVMEVQAQIGQVLPQTRESFKSVNCQAHQAPIEDLKINYNSTSGTQSSAPPALPQTSKNVDSSFLEGIWI